MTGLLQGRRPARRVPLLLQGAVLLLLLIWYGYEVAQSQADTTFLTVNLSVRYTYLSAVVGSALMLVGLAGGVWSRFRQKTPGQGTA